MASDLSPYMGNKILRWMNGDAAMPSSPSGLYIGLFDGNPKSTGTEISTTIRAAGRVVATFGTLASGVSHLLTSDVDVDFGDADGGATLSYIGLFDAATAGNLIAGHEMPGGPQTIAAGTLVKFVAGGITFNVGSDT